MKKDSEVDMGDSDEYQLLNSFEMLWNVGETTQGSSGQQSDSLILQGAIKGHALTVKEEYFSSENGLEFPLIDICREVRVK